MKMNSSFKKIISLLLTLTLVVSSLTFSKPLVSAESVGNLNGQTEGMQFITDTDEKSEYLIEIGNETLRYVETVKVSNGIQEVHTRVYNDETNELIQDLVTKIDGTTVVNQQVNEFNLDQLPEVEDNSSQLFSNQLSSNIISNRSLVTYLGVSYTTNYNVNRGYANYAGLKQKVVHLRNDSAANRSNYNKFTKAVDSLRGHENGTIAGWLITAFSSGGLAVGTLLSWQTAKVILKNIAGPVAIVTNAYALTMWIYNYNKVINSYYAIK